MWTRSELKTRAKGALKGNWLNAIVVCFIAGLLGVGAASHGGSSAASHSDTIASGAQSGLLETLLAGLVALLVIAVVIAIGLIISFFVTNIVEVGRARFFLKNRGEDKPGIGELFWLYNKEERSRFWNVAKTMIYVELKVLVGVFLFVIPGVYLMYVYRMVPFILANNPDMDPTEAQQLSKIMMDGNKMQAFILDLSFIGWDFLATLLMGLGYLVLDPYKVATNAEFYEVLRQDAIENGIVSWAALPDLSSNGNVEVLW